MANNQNGRRDHDDQGRQREDGKAMMPDDPATLNPEELASFPKQAPNGHQDVKHDSHLVTKHSPVRDGRNITRTDNNPDRRGFM